MRSGFQEVMAGRDTWELDARIDAVRAQRGRLDVLLEDVRAALAGGLPEVQPRCWASPAQQRYSERLIEVTGALGRIDRCLEEAGAALRRAEWQATRERDSLLTRASLSGSQ